MNDHPALKVTALAPPTERFLDWCQARGITVRLKERRRVDWPSRRWEANCHKGEMLGKVVLNGHCPPAFCTGKTKAEAFSGLQELCEGTTLRFGTDEFPCPDLWMETQP